MLVNGAPGFLVVQGGQPFALIGMAVRDDKITEIDILADPDRLSQLDLGPDRLTRAASRWVS